MKKIVKYLLITGLTGFLSPSIYAGCALNLVQFQNNLSYPVYIQRDNEDNGDNESWDTGDSFWWTTLSNGFWLPAGAISASGYVYHDNDDYHHHEYPYLYQTVILADQNGYPAPTDPTGSIHLKLGCDSVVLIDSESTQNFGKATINVNYQNKQGYIQDNFTIDATP